MDGPRTVKAIERNRSFRPLDIVTANLEAARGFCTTTLPAWLNGMHLILCQDASDYTYV
jgi:hypothetical protein